MTTMVAAARDASDVTPTAIHLAGPVYSLVAVLIALVGIYIARLVTIGEQDKRLGRRQTFRETGPLTAVAVLIVCPFIGHFQVAIPWASLIGLGVGYSVRVILKIIGGGAVAVARAAARQAVEALKETPSPDDEDDEAQVQRDILKPIGGPIDPQAPR